RDSQTVSIAGTLTDLRNGHKIGTFRKICPLDDAVCLQDGITYAIASMLVPRNLVLAPATPVASQALPEYLQALEFLSRDSESYPSAIPLLQEALTKDPLAVPVHIALADAYIQAYRTKTDKQALATAHKILDGVLDRSPESPGAQASLGIVLLNEGAYDDA